jgi:hypothetical protein
MSAPPVIFAYVSTVLVKGRERTQLRCSACQRWTHPYKTTNGAARDQHRHVSKKHHNRADKLRRKAN